MRTCRLIGESGAGTVEPLVAIVLAAGVFALLILLGVFT